MPGSKLLIVVLIVTSLATAASGWAETAKKEELWDATQVSTYLSKVSAKDIRTKQLIPSHAYGTLMVTIIFAKAEGAAGISKAKFAVSSTVMCSTSAGMIEAKGPKFTLTTQMGFVQKVIQYHPRDYFTQNDINPKKCELLAMIRGKNTKKGQFFTQQWFWGKGI